MRAWGKLTTAVMCLALTACGGGELDDLHQFTANAHANRKPEIEPLPQILPYRSFAYTAQKSADPFDRENLLPAQALAGADSDALAPDPNRRKDPLEAFPLDALRMVGTMTRADQVWVVVGAPDATVHHARMGDHVGQNFGIITEIQEDSIAIIERVRDPNGKWIERETGLAISQK